MASKRDSTIGEVGAHFAMSAFVGSTAMHYALQYGLPPDYTWEISYLASVLGWGPLCALLFGFVAIVNRRPYLLMRFRVVRPLPAELALTAGCAAAFLVGASVEAKISVNFLPFLALLLLYYGVAAPKVDSSTA